MQIILSIEQVENIRRLLARVDIKGSEARAVSSILDALDAAEIRERSLPAQTSEHAGQ